MVSMWKHPKHIERYKLKKKDYTLNQCFRRRPNPNVNHTKKWKQNSFVFNPRVSRKSFRQCYGLSSLLSRRTREWQRKNVPHIYLRTLQFLDAESKRSELGGDQVTVAMLSTICPVPPFPSYTEQSSDKDMTQTLAEFAAQRDARNTIELNATHFNVVYALWFHRSSQLDPYKFYIESGRKYHKIVMDWISVS